MIDYEMHVLRKTRDDLNEYKRRLQVEYNAITQRIHEIKTTIATIERITTVLQLPQPGVTDEDIVKLQQLLQEYPSLESARQQHTDAAALATELQHALIEAKAQYEAAAAAFDEHAFFIWKLTTLHGHRFDRHIHPQQEVIVRHNESQKRINVYFCKWGYPLGKGHGHYVFHAEDGRLLSRRDPV